MATIYVVPTATSPQTVFSVTVYAKAPTTGEVLRNAVAQGFKDGLKASWESMPAVQVYHVARHPLRTLDAIGYHFFAFTTCAMGVADCSSTQSKVDAAIGALSLIPFERFIPAGEFAGGIVAENEMRAAAGRTGAHGGELYPAGQLEALKKHLAKDAHGKVDVYWGEYGADWLDTWHGSAADGVFEVRADGRRVIAFRGDPTRMQVEHEVLHYLDDRYVRFDPANPRTMTQRSQPAGAAAGYGPGGFATASPLGKERVVLDGLKQPRRWSRYNNTEREFSESYVRALMLVFGK